MSIETIDTSVVMVTREVRAGGGLPGHQELAEDMARRGFDPSHYPGEIQEGLRQARARGMTRTPQEAAAFACAFAEGARALMERQNSPYAGAVVVSERKEAAERRRIEAERRAVEAREAVGREAERRSVALREASEIVGRTRYVPEDGREDVARIMAERSLSIEEAYDAWVAEGPQSLPLGLRICSTSR